MLKFIIGFILGANLGLFLYACILTGKRVDKNINNEGGQNE